MSTDNFDISEEFMRLKEDAPLSNDRVEPLEDASDSTLYSDDTKKKKKKTMIGPCMLLVNQK